MRTIWQSLAWKEWHEHKWKLLSLTIVLCAVNFLCMINGIDWQGVTESLMAMTLCCSIPLAVFVGASTAASERARHTLAYMHAQPTSLRPVAAFKLLAGLLTVSIPICLTYMFDFACFAIAGDGQIPSHSSHIIFNSPFNFDVPYFNWYLEGSLAISLISASIFLWTAACGVNRSDEVSAAAWGVLAMVICWTVVGLTASNLDARWLKEDGYWIANSFKASLPGGVATIGNSDAWRKAPTVLGVPTPIAAGILVHAGLAYWFTTRFGRNAESLVRSQRAVRKLANKPYWLGPPSHNPLTAIVWKQAREVAPLGIAGLAFVVGIVCLVVVTRGADIGIRAISQFSAGATVTVGILVALVAGIGTMLYDTNPKLNTFWRSRPINPDLWFWTKFVTGLVVIFSTLYIPVLLFALAVDGPEYVTTLLSDRESMLFPAITVGLYIAAVTMTALVRHAVYAAILSIAILYLGPLLVETGSTLFHRYFLDEPSRPFFSAESGPLMAIAMGVVVFATLILGWLAVRYDWGRKSRY